MLNFNEQNKGCKEGLKLAREGKNGLNRRNHVEFEFKHRTPDRGTTEKNS